MKGLWGKKIGMTQLFVDNKVVPVTVIDAANWYITLIRNQERDGYAAVQVGCLRPRYLEAPFDINWVKQPKKYFSYIREIKLEKDPTELGLEIGQQADFFSFLTEGEKVDALARSIGRGFSGVMRRHNFAGPPGSHGSRMGRRPGSIGGARTQGKVLRGKKMPGQFGNEQKTIRGLSVVSIKPEQKVIFVKGSVPGKVGSLVFLKKQA